jgi:integrase
MAVTKRPNGTWQVQVVLGHNPRTGKIDRRSWTFDSKADALEFERREQARMARLREEHVHPSAQKLDEYLVEWIEHKKSDGTKPKTVFDYQAVIRRCINPSLGRIPLADLSPLKLQRWQDALAGSPDARGATQAAQAHRVLRSALSDAVRLGMLPSNPAKNARPALRSGRKRDGYTLAEAQALVTAAEGDRIAHLIAFVLHSGLRHGEALALRWQDVDLDAGVLTVRHNRVPVGGSMVEGSPKTRRSTRTFALPGPALAALRGQWAMQAEERAAAGEAWSAEDRVFATKTGAGLDENNVGRAFRRVRERAGVRPLPFHSLRHATASILLASGVHVAVAAKMMGHSVAMFCETYADLLVEATRDAARQVDAFWASRTPPQAADRATVSRSPVARADAARDRAQPRHDGEFGRHPGRPRTKRGPELER